MKRFIALLLAILLLCPLTAAGESDDESDVYNYFRSLQGNISFTLPYMPTVIREMDYDDMWTNNTELFGNFADGGEYQIHTADLSPYFEAMAKEHPDEEYYQYQLNALVSYTEFYLNIYSASIASVEPFLFAKDRPECVGAEIAFTYPDTPGVKYEAFGLIDGTLAMALVGVSGEAFDELKAEIALLTPEETEAFRSRPEDARTLHELSVVFPCPADYSFKNGSEYITAFGEDYTDLHCQFAYLKPRTAGCDEDDKKLETLMTGMATLSFKIPLEAKYMEADKPVRLAKGTYMMDCVCDVAPSDEIDCITRSYIYRLYVSPTGTYFLFADDTIAGRAFIESAVFTPEGE